MKRIALTAATVLALSAPAFAGGADQLARSVGVAPGTYSLSQLTALKDATEANDFDRIALIKSNAAGSGEYATTASTSNYGNGAGKTQLAAAAGVDASDYSLAELVALNDALSSDDHQRVNFIKNGGFQNDGENGYVSTKSVGSAATKQLAASVGAADSNASVAELAIEFADIGADD